MRFQLVDRITAFTPGAKLAATKRLTLGEEYLADHFPAFPVMPGVLMLETLVQSAAWLIRLTEDFAPAIITLKEVKGLKYGTFMPPGHTMSLAVEVQGAYQPELPTVSFKGSGEQGGQAVVNARFVLRKTRLSETKPAWAEVENRLRQQYREQALLLWPGTTS